MDLTPVVNRLGASVAGLRAVGGAADYAAAAADLKATPAAFVLPLGERVAGNPLANALSQQVEVSLAVIVAVSNLRDARGAAALGSLEALRLAVRQALLGWSPGSEYSPFEMASGRLLELSDRVLWWLDEWKTVTYLRLL